MIGQGCSDDYNAVGVNSPRPGVLQVFLQSDDTDNYLVVAGDTVTVQEGSTDSLDLSVGQGRAYRDDDYAILYRTLNDYQEVTRTYNAIRIEGGKYVEYKIFEVYLPPAEYDSLKISITATFLRIGLYQIPLTPLPGEDALVKFTQSFRIDEGKTTAVRLSLKPFASLQRVGDTYQYSWQIHILEILYL